MTRKTAGGRRRRLAVVALGGVSALLLAGCSQETVDDWKRAGMPAPITEEGDRMLHLWQGSWIAALAVGALVWGLIFWSIIVYRRRHNSEMPDQVRYNLPMEIMYTIIPLIMIGGMLYFTARDQVELTSVENNQDLTVGVVGFRWSWTFNYVEPNTYEVGTPGGAGPTLYLPVDQKVKFELTSPDVVHSFWVPAFLFKMDVVPGRTNQFEVTPNKEGTFLGKCAELCGVDHSRMLFTVKVVSEEEFEARMQELRDKGQFGQMNPGRATEAAQGV